MRFKVDENLPVQCVDQLRDAGHDALSVHDQGLSGARVLDRVLLLLPDESPAGRLWIVEEDNVGIGES